MRDPKLLLVSPAQCRRHDQGEGDGLGFGDQGGIVWAARGGPQIGRWGGTWLGWAPWKRRVGRRSRCVASGVVAAGRKEVRRQRGQDRRTSQSCSQVVARWGGDGLVPSGARGGVSAEGFVAPSGPRVGPVAASVVLRLDISCRGRKRQARAEEGDLLGREVSIL